MDDVVYKTETRALEHENPENEKGREFMSDALIAWQAQEYDHYPKSTDWYWMVGIIAVALSVVAILMKNPLFVIIVLLGGFSIALYGARHPHMISFAITPRGIKIDNRLFVYDDLESFWIHYDPPHKKELGIISKKVLMPRIAIPLGDADPNKVREHLIKFLEEEHHEEGLSEAIARIAGF